jgi:serine/threonine-protein kinase
LANLEPQVPMLTVRVENEKPQQQVLLDGAPVRAAAWGTPIAVDPGPHQLEANAAGYAAWKGPLEMKAGERKVVVIPELAVDRTPGPAAAPASDTAKPPAAAEGGHSNAAGWVILGTGVVGLGIGTYFGVSALSKQNEVEKECPTSLTCSSKGVELSNDAQKAAWASNIGIGIGVVGVLVGGYLLLTSPSSAKPGSALSARSPLRVSASPHGGELGFQGVW